MDTRVNSPERAVRMAMQRSRTLIVLFVMAWGLCGSLWAQDDVNVPVTPVAVPSQAEAIQRAGLPYVAEITGNDVYIRSGAGDNFYRCGKLFRGDEVSVVKTQQGWSCIEPPPGCFSWIAMQYVSINLANPTMGIVTGDNVGVYAGSDYVEPMYSTSKQVTLNRGDNVKLLGEERDDYYKIAPPDGAHLWVSSQYVESQAGPAGDAPVRTESTDGQPQGPSGTGPGVQVEPDLLATYYALSKLVKAEHGKPVAEQDYTEIKKKLQELAENEAGGKPARYADFTLKQVKRFELACTVAKEIAMQSKELTKVSDQIDEARAARLAQIENLGKFAVIGTLQSSSIYTTEQKKRYRILDDSKKTICYIEPASTATGTDLSKLMGKKVGVVGRIKPHEPTARALVEFTAVIAVDQKEEASPSAVQ